ncbi:MAG: prolyl hydroxylase family protein [Sphingobium sp.]
MSNWQILPPAATADPALIARHPTVQRFPGRALILFQQKNFLSAEECAGLIACIDARRRPSTLADANGDESFRTSETCDLDSADPFIAGIDARIAGYLGINPLHGEPIQGQRYAVGQQFKAHTDYFEPDGPDYARYCSVAGNRNWTAMIYLNEPAAGGATRFTKIGKTIQPQTGKMLLWSNRREDGALNPDSIHQGMKVRSGTKYIITKWFRERSWSG